jgi:hypothetical protein
MLVASIYPDSVSLHPGYAGYVPEKPLLSFAFPPLPLALRLAVLRAFRRSAPAQ